jgi:hypothetical protein
MQGEMAKVWVLDTETKGTGAQMVPLEKVLKPGAPRSESLYVPAPPRPRPPEEPAPRQPRRFRVVDVMTRAVLAGDAGLRETLDTLRDVRSTVDVRVSVWEPETDTWRLLTLGEQRMLWELRERA